MSCTEYGTHLHDRCSWTESDQDERPTAEGGQRDRTEDREGEREAPTPQEDWPAPVSIRRPIRMLQCVYMESMKFLTSREPECAGMLLGPAGSDVVTHFVVDKYGRATGASFTLDAAWLNRVLREFQRCGINAKGLLHSHPEGITGPSGGDVSYVRRALANPKNQDCLEFYLPIVCGGRLYPYVITREDPSRVLLADLVLI